MNYELLTEFFMWCTIFNGVLLILFAVTGFFGLDFVYRLHSRFFPMPRETFNVVIYSIIGLYKLLFLMFSAVPYLALLMMG